MARHGGPSVAVAGEPKRVVDILAIFPQLCERWTSLSGHMELTFEIVDLVIRIFGRRARAQLRPCAASRQESRHRNRGENVDS